MIIFTVCFHRLVTQEVVELGVSSANNIEESGCTGVPAHALVALELLLKLPGYADALLDEGARAVHLLRLLLGVTHDEDGREYLLALLVYYTLDEKRNLEESKFQIFIPLVTKVEQKTNCLAIRPSASSTKQASKY